MYILQGQFLHVQTVPQRGTHFYVNLNIALLLQYDRTIGYALLFEIKILVNIRNAKRPQFGRPLFCGERANDGVPS
jgi:hypothetical protein